MARRWTSLRDPDRRHASNGAKRHIPSADPYRKPSLVFSRPCKSYDFLYPILLDNSVIPCYNGLCLVVIARLFLPAHFASPSACCQVSAFSFFQTLTPLKSALTQKPPVTSLESALPKQRT